MKRFMIGQAGHFNESKYLRDFRTSFYGMEACMYANEKEVEKLIAVAREDKLNIGIHFPLRSWAMKHRDPQFLTLDDEQREQFYKLMEEEFIYLQKVRPQYILFHYPKPVILDDRLDWSIWRFGDKSEYVYESEYAFEELIKKSEYLFSWLSNKAVEYDFIPILELDALNRYIYDTNLLEELLNKYPKVKLCIDIGRLHYQAKVDENFKPISIIKRFAKYAEVVHLWNVKINKISEYHHYPVLPNLQPSEGWAPVEEYLRVITEENKHAKILFEHRSDLISDEELQDCYDWVAGILGD